MSERIIPDWDRLALKVIPPPDSVDINGTTFVIPDEAKERPQQAYIVGIGPDCSMIPVEKHPRAMMLNSLSLLGEVLYILDSQEYAEGCLVHKYRVGDKVFVGRFSGTEITPNFQDQETWIRIIREGEILARVVD